MVMRYGIVALLSLRLSAIQVNHFDFDYLFIYDYASVCERDGCGQLLLRVYLVSSCLFSHSKLYSVKMMGTIAVGR